MVSEILKNWGGIVAFIGIVLTFIVGVANLIITIRNSRRSNFISSITASRINYIQEFRNNISHFCGLIFTYNLAFPYAKTDSKENSEQEQRLYELHKEADKIKYLLKLYLNPTDEYWDKTIMNLIDEILTLTDKDPSKKIDELITITQYLLKLEWEGAKLESQKGVISDFEKKELYNKYVALHKNFAIDNDK